MLGLAKEHTNNFNSDYNLNALKVNFAPLNQAEPGSGFPDSHDFRPKSNFWIHRLSQQHPVKPKSLVLKGTAPFERPRALHQSLVHCRVLFTAQGKGFRELCASAMFSTVRVRSPQRNSQSLNFAAVSKSFPAGIVMLISQSLSS